MAPARTTEEDPVTTEYDIYLTPSTQQQIYLLQYPNRNRDRPYTSRLGARPEELRIKPQSGHLELDVNLNTEHNFNKWQGLKWGDAIRTGREAQNESATYGLASGFSAPVSKAPTATNTRRPLKDQAERALDLSNDLRMFYDAQDGERVMRTQTLGGQIAKNDSWSEAGKPLYFVGAFRGAELHLSRVAGTVQMRPQFHHLDAEDHRNRLASSRDHGGNAADAMDGLEPSASSSRPKKEEPQAQALLTSYRPQSDLAARESQMRKTLREATEEQWVSLDFVDEEEEEAFKVWEERMFVNDTAEAKCPRLKSAMDNEEFLEAISAPRKGSSSTTRRRRRSGRKRDAVELVDGDGEEGGEG